MVVHILATPVLTFCIIGPLVLMCPSLRWSGSVVQTLWQKLNHSILACCLYQRPSYSFIIILLVWDIFKLLKYLIKSKHNHLHYIVVAVLENVDYSGKLFSGYNFWNSVRNIINCKTQCISFTCIAQTFIAIHNICLCNNIPKHLQIFCSSWSSSVTVRSDKHK